jgi:hypothetical protein
MPRPVRAGWFTEEYVPNYFKGKSSPASKSNNPHRNLEQILQEISLACSGLSTTEIARITKRDRVAVGGFLFGTQVGTRVLGSMIISFIRQKHNLPLLG